MKRRLYYTLLIMVTASCMLYGTFRHILGIGLDIDPAVDDLINLSQEDGSGEFNQQLNAFRSIKADLDVCSITIQKGDSYSISGQYIKDMKSDFKVIKSVLTIKQSDASAEHVLGVRRDDNRIVITIPEEASLKRIDLNTTVATINLENIDAQRCRIINQTGDLFISGMTSDYAMLRVEAGNIELEQMDFQRLHVRSGVSEVHLSTPLNLADYKVSVSTDVGIVNYGGDEFRNSYEEENDTGKVLEINNGTGDILVSYKSK